LRGQAVQDGGEASIGGRRFVEPGDEAAAVGGREGERDDLAGEQRVDEPAGAALPRVRTPRGVEAVALGDGAQGRLVLGRQGPHASLLGVGTGINYLVS